MDSSDFALLVGAFGADASVADSGYDAGAEFNCDVVDSSDFSLLVGSFGAVGDM